MLKLLVSLEQKVVSDSKCGSFSTLVTYNYLDTLIGHPKISWMAYFSIVLNKVSNHWI